MGYVNDAFGTAHRAHSSMVGEGYEVKVAVALVEKELSAFSKVLDEPARPVLAILGGAKVSDKMQLIKNLTSKGDKMIVGGGMAFTFAKVLHGANIGDSLFDEEGAKIVPEIMESAKAANVEMIFPMDFTVSSKFGEDGEIKEGVTWRRAFRTGSWALIAAPSATRRTRLRSWSPRLIWNGPMGVFEMDKFAVGTKSMMDAVVAATQAGTITVIGGGDTATACKKYDTEDKVTHCSTGGGASLELLEGKDLPGISALSSK